MLIGYARISTSEQSLNLQIDALKKEGCNKIFSDIASGAKTERKGLNEALNFLRKGDTLLVWRLDRLGRTVKHLIDTLNWLEEQGIGFKSLHENIDTISPTGKLVTNIFMALAEFERNLIRERTKAGLEAARARGKSGGRPKLLSPAEADNLRKLLKQEIIPLQSYVNSSILAQQRFTSTLIMTHTVYHSRKIKLNQNNSCC